MQLLARTFLEALTSGVQGAVTDARPLARPWGFDTKDASARLSLWHGDDDTISPIARARTFAQSLLDTSCTTLTGEGHLSVLLNHRQRILSELDSY